MAFHPHSLAIRRAYTHDLEWKALGPSQNPWEQQPQYPPEPWQPSPQPSQPPLKLSQHPLQHPQYGQVLPPEHSHHLLPFSQPEAAPQTGPTKQTLQEELAVLSQQAFPKEASQLHSPAGPQSPTPAQAQLVAQPQQASQAQPAAPAGSQLDLSQGSPQRPHIPSRPSSKQAPQAELEGQVSQLKLARNKQAVEAEDTRGAWGLAEETGIMGGHHTTPIRATRALSRAKTNLMGSAVHSVASLTIQPMHFGRWRSERRRPSSAPAVATGI